jgi:RND family efflux transporter MFP subunit
MSASVRSSAAWRVLKQVAVGLVFLVVVVLLMMYLMGTLSRKISVVGHAVPEGRPVGGARVVGARTIRVPVTESAVGTVRAVREASVASKILAKVLEVKVKAGQQVAKDEVLVRLDDADLKARLQQAQAAASAARAQRDQAKTELERIQGLFKQNAAAPIELERAQTAYKTAESEVERTAQGVREGETTLNYATVRSPFDGIVVDKKVDAGDTVMPGQVLLNLFDPTHMQLVASVRESLTHRLSVGQIIGVQIESLQRTCEGRVSEIVPEAQTASRTFSVKVTGPCPPGIYSGMFGRLLIPLDVEDVLVIPRAAVRHIGQLDIVEVAEGNFLRRRAVRLGRSFGDEVQVLSGLRAGEKVAVPGTDQPASRGA